MLFSPEWSEIAPEKCYFYLKNVYWKDIYSIQKDLSICFIDYSKVFDRVRHAELLNILEKVDFNGKKVHVVLFEPVGC